jgi:hypothetical protein
MAKLVALSPGLHTKAKFLALKKGITLRALVNEAVALFIANKIASRKEG